MKFKIIIMLRYNNKGLALPLILIFLTAALLLCTVALAVAQSQTMNVKNYSDNQDASYYAEAGISDAIFRLNGDQSFYNSNQTLSNEVPLGAAEGYYKYTTTKPDAANHYVTVKSTGWSKNEPLKKVTIEAKVCKKSFTQYLFVSDFETTLPDNNNNFTTVFWGDSDTIHGPVHTNNILNINGNPKFYGKVTYSKGKDIKGFPSYLWETGATPQQKPELEFPLTNNDLVKWANVDGMVFYGRTCILLKSNGKVSIRNSAIQATNNTKEYDIPKNKVIYVDQVSGTTDNSKWSFNSGNVFISGTLNGQLTVAAANDIYITGYDPTDWDEPSIWDSQPDGYTGGLKYANTTFNANGTLNKNGVDMLGLTANGAVRILHWNWPAKANQDQGGYWMRQTVFSGIRNYDVTSKNITINAAILSLNSVFEFEDWQYQDPRIWWANYLKKNGKITLNGSITQKYVGGVGTYTGFFKYIANIAGWDERGYERDYYHDTRMLYQTPPHFTDPKQVGWEIREWKKVPNP